MLRASLIAFSIGLVSAFRVDKDTRRATAEAVHEERSLDAAAEEDDHPKGEKKLPSPKPSPKPSPSGSQQPTQQRNFCSVSGDPHLMGFDQQWKGGKRWHPMHAEGHYWLVKTETGKIQVQATYGRCGKKSGGWMSARLKGVPRTCLTGIAVSGSFLGGKTLALQAPCDWDWDNQNCRNADKAPRITWNGGRVNSVSEAGVAVSAKGRDLKVTLPDNMQIDLQMAGNWGRSAHTYMNAKIWMVQGSGGKQCGHCGNYDGNGDNDQIYERTGEMKAMVPSSRASRSLMQVAGALVEGGERASWGERRRAPAAGPAPLTSGGARCDANPTCAALGLTGECCPTNDGVLLDCCKGGLCDAIVGCSDRLISGGPACTTTTTPATTTPATVVNVRTTTVSTTTPSEACPKEVRDMAEENCRDKFAQAIDPALAGKIPVDISDEELEDCILDVCLGGDDFAKDDAADAVKEDAAFIKAGVMARRKV